MFGRGPQHIREDTTIGEARDVDASLVHIVVLADGGKCRVEEFHVAVILIAGASLPAGALSFRINFGWRVDALHVNDDRFRPDRLDVHRAGNVFHVPAMAVEDKHQRRAARLGRRRRGVDNSVTLKTLHVERELFGLGRANRGDDDNEDSKRSAKSCEPIHG